MITLQQYILERQTIGKLPFTVDQLEQFISDVLNFEDDSDTYINMKETIISQYGKPVFDMFCSFLSGYNYLKKYFKGTTDLYKFLQKLSANLVKKTIGSGSYGMVFELGSGYIMKIAYCETLHPSDKAFYEYCLSHKQIKCLPKIMHMGKNWVVMEKLNIHTKKSDLWGNYIDDHYNQTPDKYTDAPEGLKEWAQEVSNIMNELNINQYKGAEFYWPGDINARNIGERSNGDIVVFDPIYTNGFW